LPHIAWSLGQRALAIAQRSGLYLKQVSVLINVAAATFSLIHQYLSLIAVSKVARLIF